MLKTNYGLFEYLGKQKFIDLIHDEEFKASDSGVMLMKGEVFSGRRVSYGKVNIFTWNVHCSSRGEEDSITKNEATKKRFIQKRNLSIFN